MSDLAIRCEGIAKQYQIGERETYRALRDALTEAFTAPFRRVQAALRRGDGGAPGGPPTIWAVKDISFEVRQGEVLGVIGRNGAGKSTLLKILSRITKPTRGTADIYGRVGSLLEVGTGFHPELTGRENVYLNGAILGMKKAEIARKFDEIVDFAELTDFVDTPVKRYSSGMYVRLAFAVAAHLETEVLFVDEVLAVGDADFQTKCLGKMDDVAKTGRTVLFVSHSTSAIQRLCPRCILLAGGRIDFDGSTEEAIGRYLRRVATDRYSAAADLEKPTITLASCEWVKREQCIVIRIGFQAPFPLYPPIVGVIVCDSARLPVFGTNQRFEHDDNLPKSMQNGIIEVCVSTSALRAGTYNISLWLADQYNDYCELRDVLSVQVDGPLPSGPQPPRSWIGSARLHTSYKYYEGDPNLMIGDARLV